MDQLYHGKSNSKWLNFLITTSPTFTLFWLKEREMTLHNIKDKGNNDAFKTFKKAYMDVCH